MVDPLSPLQMVLFSNIFGRQVSCCELLFLELRTNCSITRHSLRTEQQTLCIEYAASRTGGSEDFEVMQLHRHS